MAEYFCVTCRTPFQNEYPLDEEGRCGVCRMGLSGYDAVYSFGAYDGTLRQLIHLFKYSRIQSLDKPLSELLLAALPREQRFDAIVPMPMHWRRRWQRGFNQAELLAARVSRRTGLPLLQPLRRLRAGGPQAGLSNAQRRANVSGVFRPKKKDALRGLRVLLVDDVLTTGATASASSAALKRAGAKHVSVLTLARVDRRALGGGHDGQESLMEAGSLAV